MKCLVCRSFGSLEQLTVEDMPTPTPGPMQVRIAVRAAALNYPDALMAQGQYQVKPPLPFVPGIEFSGVIAEVGPGVTQLTIGQQVVALGLGGLGEEALAAAEQVMPLPHGMDFDTAAAFFLTFCTSLRALKNCARLAVGETLLVLGASGGVGMAAIQIGKAMGARVIAAASTNEKLGVCKQWGADHVINYDAEDLRTRVKELTAGKGVDVVFDPVGGGYSEEALRITAWGGRHLVIGFAAGDIPKLPLNLLLMKERSLIGVYWGESLAHDMPSHLSNARQLMTWFNNGQIKPYISERVPLGGAAAAMKRMTNRQVIGKVVVQPWA